MTNTNFKKARLGRGAAGLLTLGALLGVTGTLSQAQSMNNMSASQVIAQWPADARKAAQKTIVLHGRPDEITPSTLTWHNSGPWKRLVASRTPFLHKFPAPHPDSLEGVIDYQVPENKFDDLARFDGSIIVERTKGEMSARCDADTHNFLALNLAHDIVTGKKTVGQARAFYGRAVKMEMDEGKLHPYLMKFMFSTNRGMTADPGKQTIMINK